MLSTRRYLMTFILPGEAQKIDRIMDAFAQSYYQCNPDLYASAGEFQSTRRRLDQRAYVRLSSSSLFFLVRRSVLHSLIRPDHAEYIAA